MKDGRYPEGQVSAARETDTLFNLLSEGGGGGVGGDGVILQLSWAAFSPPADCLDRF